MTFSSRPSLQSKNWDLPEARNTMIAVVEARLVEHEKDRLASRNEDERLSALACKECCKIVLDSLRTLH